VITSPTALLRAALVALASLPNFAAATLSGQEPPTAVIVREDFVPLDEQWQPASGNWSVSAGTYNSTAAGTTDLTRIINKIIQSIRYQVASFPHTVPSNTWFNVQLVRSGIYTTFKVNGVVVARDVPQG
jgi:hypothetical protein